MQKKKQLQTTIKQTLSACQLNQPTSKKYQLEEEEKKNSCRINENIKKETDYDYIIQQQQQHFGK